MRRWLFCILLATVACGGGNDDGAGTSTSTMPAADRAAQVNLAKTTADFCKDFEAAQPVYNDFRPTSIKSFEDLRTAVRGIRYPADLEGHAATLDIAIGKMITKLNGVDFESGGRARVKELAKTADIKAGILAYFTIDLVGSARCKATS